MTTVPGVPERAHPLLLDWLETHPAAQRRAGPVLVVGCDPDADAVARAHGTGVVRAAVAAREPPEPGAFDLVVIVLDREVPAAAALVGRASLLAGSGQLLLIAPVPSSDPSGVLAPLASAGLYLLSFDDVTDGPLGDRWVRALYATSPSRTF